MFAHHPFIIEVAQTSSFEFWILKLKELSLQSQFFFFFFFFISPRKYDEIVKLFKYFSHFWRFRYNNKLREDTIGIRYPKKI